MQLFSVLFGVRIRHMKVFIKFFLNFGFSFFLSHPCQAQNSVWSSGPWNSKDGSTSESRETSGSEAREAQDFKNNVMALKNKRDADISALIKERDAKLKAMTDDYNKVTQADLVQINKDKAQIQKNIVMGQDMAKAKALLAQEERVFEQKTAVMQQQISNVKLIYDQQLQRLVMAYAQQFEILKQQAATEH